MSKSPTAAQNNYSTTELECLVVIREVQKCSYYLLGQQDFVVLTDHKPLQGVFEKDLFYLLSPHLQRLREKVAAYSLAIKWSPGKIHLIADALSRAPLFA